MCIFDGNPNGRIMCELSNWNGRVYKISRNDLSEFGNRPDAEYTGVYFLFGKNADNDDTVYIGEAERMMTRLKQHLKDENYWNECIAIISKDNVLNKAHVKFLEHKFYHLAQDARRAVVVNGSDPTCSSISEYDEAMLEEFIDNAKLLVNTLGYKVFDAIELISPTEENDNAFHLSASRGDAHAQGGLVADGFVVFKGSKIASNTVPSMSDSLKKLRQKLIDKGIVDSDFLFTNDYIFTSPSLAAAIVLGRSANGRIEWKTAEQKTLNMLEKA